ncbi:putative membrane protein YphA (DoxX/SURF4 family) [Dyadobacter jejuensis]|uniref:Putative membrane protein YphA (DoxX/SURF4 family) n=1 Tax=Dyadobacter jejuensis TaxID=1082580 RepID=A0A316ASU3_9BACT|nr:DoxX family protein [Dyadobacter jejuensis]PWJ59890.1 putative membrane protein YphA (DoxX/SURF4 family) [Dyadobacter jejuensis]
MKIIDKIEQWGDAHHPAWLDFLRIGLGALLFFKGVSFISDTARIMELVSGLDIQLWTVTAIHYVAFAHIFGGFMIAIGALTRLAAIVQLPILITAVFFVNLRMGFSYLNSELWLSLLTLFLLVLFIVVGSGTMSTDEYMRKHNR